MTNHVINKAAKNISGILALTLVYLPATSFSSYAEQLPVASNTSLFLKMDANRDGLISQGEIYKKSLLALKFDSFDKNRDGSLDANEFQTFIMYANI